MATDEHVAPLTKSIDTALQYKETELVMREKWGSITFEKVKRPRFSESFRSRGLG